MIRKRRFSSPYIRMVVAMSRATRAQGDSMETYIYKSLQTEESLNIWR